MDIVVLSDEPDTIRALIPQVAQRPGGLLTAPLPTACLDR